MNSREQMSSNQEKTNTSDLYLQKKDNEFSESWEIKLKEIYQSIDLGPNKGVDSISVDTQDKLDKILNLLNQHKNESDFQDKFKILKNILISQKIPIQDFIELPKYAYYLMPIM